jgi:hypothetical protein
MQALILSNQGFFYVFLPILFTLITANTSK